MATQASVFDDVVKAFEGSFTYEDVKKVLHRTSNWDKSDYYIKSLLKDRVNKRMLLQDGDHYTVNDLASEGFKRSPSNKQMERDANSHNELDSKKSITFTKNALCGTDLLKYFVYTIKQYKRMLTANRIIDYKKYFAPTDRLFLYDPAEALTDLQFVFKEMAYHAQNSKLGQSIKFIHNERAIYTYTQKFDPTDFNSYITRVGEGNAISDLESTLGISKDAATNYFKALKSSALYLIGKSSKNDVKSDFIGYMTPNINYVGLYNAFRGNIPNGFGKALVFDFLKEFDPVFDLPKPDLHVKRALIFLYNDATIMETFAGKNATKFNADTTVESLNAVGLYLELMNEINNQYHAIGGVKLIPNYILDKMIYLIGSGELYLDRLHDESLKYSYLDAVRTRTFGIYSNADMIREIDSIL